MFGWDFEVDARSRFWRCLIKMCVWTCDMTQRSYFGSLCLWQCFSFKCRDFSWLKQGEDCECCLMWLCDFQITVETTKTYFYEMHIQLLHYLTLSALKLTSSCLACHSVLNLVSHNQIRSVISRPKSTHAPCKDVWYHRGKCGLGWKLAKPALTPCELLS